MTRRSLTDDERDIWRRAVRDVRPARPVPLDPPPQKARRIAPHRARNAVNPIAPSPAPRAPHVVFGGGDPALDRAAASRRISIDRVIDLHGLTQTGAHRLLLSRLPQAAAAGERLVLVITGKGRAARPRLSDPGAGGVLRARFFDWIEAPPLKGLIARVAQAKPKDGGAGAFYVFLKRKGAGGAPPRR